MIGSAAVVNCRLAPCTTSLLLVAFSSKIPFLEDPADKNPESSSAILNVAVAY